MRKFTLLIVAVLMAITASAQKLDIKQLVRPVSPKGNMVARALPENAKPVKPFKLNKKARKAAGVTSIDDLTGTWMQIYYSYFDKTILSTVVEITKTEGSENSITISGWWGSWAEPIEATVDLAAGTVTVAPQLIYEYEGDVSAELVNSSSETEGAPLVGTIDEDGSINFEDGWAAMFVDGSGYAYEVGLYTSLVRPNGKMNYTYDNDDYSDDIYIEEDEEGMVYVYNFGDFGRMITLQLNSDKTVSAPSDQVIYNSSTHGDYILYGINGEANVPLTGIGTETTITFDQPWSGVTEDGYWLGEYSSCTIILTDGTSFIYPEDPTGISTVNANEQNGGKAYNMAGQLVKQGYKGIVVKNGKKFLMK